MQVSESIKMYEKFYYLFLLTIIERILFTIVTIVKQIGFIFENSMHLYGYYSYPMSNRSCYKGCSFMLNHCFLIIDQDNELM